MNILFAMAILAGDAGILEGGRLVTGFASSNHVQPDQRESCQAVVELYIVAPGRVIMTISAI